MFALLFLLIVFSFFLLLVGGVIAMVRASGRASSAASPAIFSIIPRPAKIIASTFLACGLVIGPIAGYIEQTVGNGWVPFHGVPLPLLGAVIGLGMGVFVGSIFAAMTLCYGYVYGDARRRGMPAVPWTFVVILVPNLLGFLLYFILRKPIASPCLQCGQAITPQQRFCSWCGHQQYTAPYTTAVAPTSPTGL